MLGGRIHGIRLAGDQTHGLVYDDYHSPSFGRASAEAEVFPERMCENLPEVKPEVKAWVADAALELAQVSVRELPEKTALDISIASGGRGLWEAVTSSPTACSGNRAPSISREKRFAPRTRPSCWTS